MTIIPVHVVPETGSDERMHVLDHIGACWCRPLNEFIPVEADGGRNQWRITHRAPTEGQDHG
jgi:hypothetical protein